MLFHEDRQQKAKLLIDQIVLPLSFLSEEPLQFPLRHLYLFMCPDQNDISQIIGQIQKGMSQVFPHLLILFDPHLAWIHQRLDLFNVVHDHVAIYFLYENTFHFYALKLVH